MRSQRVVVVGCGNMGSSHARAYANLRGFTLAALVDRSREKAARLAEELGGVPVSDSLQEAIASAHPDAACICTYPETHPALTLQALEARLHVFVEKPLAPSVAGAEEVVRRAGETRRKVVVGYILRQNPAWQRFIEEARQLGNPLSCV